MGISLRVMVLVTITRKEIRFLPPFQSTSASLLVRSSGRPVHSGLVLQLELGGRIWKGERKQSQKVS